MSNKFITQYVADGVTKSFLFNFNIVQGRSVNVYKTLSGNSANEDDDIIATNTFIVTLTDPSASLSKGNVIFNTAPVLDSVITITPDGKTNVTVNFSNTTPLNQDNLNKSYNQQSSTIEQDNENFKTSSLRYNINENKSDIDYSNILSPLKDKSFWRRSGSEIVAQDYDLFVNEVEQDISSTVVAQVNASAVNTNITAELAGNAIHTPVNGDILKIDVNGNVVVDKTLTNVVSGLASAHWSKEWAVSPLEITDDFGNIGFSAKHYSALSGIAATSTSGLIDELFVFDAEGPTTRIDLIEYQSNPNKPWIDVLDNSFTLYIDGRLILSPSAYTGGGGETTGSTYSYIVTIVDNPTLAVPSYLTISPEVPPNTQITVSRGVAQGDSSTMFATGSNYKKESVDSKIANRDLSNVAIANYPIADFKILPLNYLMKTSAYTAVSGDFIMCDTLAIGSFPVTFPVGQNGDIISVTDIKDNWIVANLTLVPSTGESIMGLAINETLVLDRKSITVTFRFLNNNWRII